MRGIDPGAVAPPHLQVGDAIGGKDGQVAVVGVRSGTEIGAVTGRIVQQPQGGHRPFKARGEEVLVQPEVQGETTVDLDGESRAGLVVGKRLIAPAQ